MADNEKMLINATLEISEDILPLVVETAKKKYGPDASGRYTIDTFEVLSSLISDFLEDADFRTYARKPENYRSHE